MYPSAAITLCVVLLSILVSGANSDGDESDHGIISGRLRTSDGSHCTWFEVKSGPTETTLGLACVCRDAARKSQGYTCEYTGDVRDCPEYTVHGNQFFGQLTKELAANYTNVCDPTIEAISNDKCPGTVLKQKVVKPRENPCVPEAYKSTEHQEL